eukprot:TRINITY_DN12396_c0_g1_i2.p1 TRINITY_DN12396_c0_g1~~TRINITY_DN12396_c0_g1_i2.p1  ORF type:complete len:100 (-),score=13.79 TRINITY_DN12396_c0_g1_i2:479-778(-)
MHQLCINPLSSSFSLSSSSPLTPFSSPLRPFSLSLSLSNLFSPIQEQPLLSALSSLSLIYEIYCISSVFLSSHSQPPLNMTIPLDYYRVVQPNPYSPSN